MAKEVIKSGLTNAYGEVEFIRDGDRYYMRLENHSDSSATDISQELFNEAKKQNWGMEYDPFYEDGQ